MGWTILAIIVLVFNLVFSGVIIFRERKNTASTWAWLFVINALPVVGFIAYLLIGRGISNFRMYRLRREIRPNYERELAVIRENKGEMEPYLSNLTNNHVVEQLIQMLYKEEDALLSINSNVEVLTDGRLKFDRLIEDIQNAQHHVHLEYYLVRMDNLGKEVYAALIDAARRGVEVRFLIDAWGSYFLRRKQFKELLEAGGHVTFFFKSFIPLLNPRFNYRLHRKIAVIDGLIGYTGGFNIGDEYVETTKRFGYWRDTHLRLSGDIVYALQERFMMDWNSQKSNEIDLQATKYFPKSVRLGSAVTQFISSGPDSEAQAIKMTFLKMINGAEREIIIQSPYYIPDSSVHDALKLALLSGVSVKLMIPNKPDHPLVYWASYYYSAQLVGYGAEVYTYENGFIHAKMIVVDEVYTSIGSANFDNRSFQLDFEGNLMIYDEKIAKDFKATFLTDVKVSRVLTQERYARRSYWVRMREGLARLISPLL